ncbi:SgcJ/EcaC family oxidoreductase, partial [Persicitalea sp.]|uniref:YybH family protein n=1 Tax=Persicitalea sp. TaxID=3100273 RepID=UPI0035946C12
NYLNIVLILVALLTLSCNDSTEKQEAAETTEIAAPDPSQTRAEIEAVETAWAESINTKNLSAMMELYGDDAVSMPNNAPTLVGKEAIRAYQEQDFASNSREGTISFETMDVFSMGDQVLEVGKSTFQHASGDKATTGSYMALFEKRDGKYVCIREIYNEDQEEE